MYNSCIYPVPAPRKAVPKSRCSRNSTASSHGISDCSASGGRSLIKEKHFHFSIDDKAVEKSLSSQVLRQALTEQCLMLVREHILAYQDLFLGYVILSSPKLTSAFALSAHSLTISNDLMASLRAPVAVIGAVVEIET